jgi:hypothetical protein
MKARVVRIVRDLVDELTLEREPDAQRSGRGGERDVVKAVAPADAPAGAIEREPGNKERVDRPERDRGTRGRLAQAEVREHELGRDGGVERQLALAVDDARIDDGRAGGAAVSTSLPLVA